MDPKTIKCLGCGGLGKKCPACKGTGEILETQQVDIFDFIFEELPNAKT